MKFRQPNGKENRLSFGKYPDVSLEQARQKRDEARKLKAAGIDPAENRRAEKEADQERASNTFEKIANIRRNQVYLGCGTDPASLLCNMRDQCIYTGSGRSISDILFRIRNKNVFRGNNLKAILYVVQLIE